MTSDELDAIAAQAGYPKPTDWPINPSEQNAWLAARQAAKTATGDRTAAAWHAGSEYAEIAAALESPVVSASPGSVDITWWTSGPLTDRSGERCEVQVTETYGRGEHDVMVQLFGAESLIGDEVRRFAAAVALAERLVDALRSLQAGGVSLAA
ncbi:hypothetical protein [Tsukamurella tyrosinosolvens]|uniref:hypothetical protein n=1 Tax=Tsukamurella tyrosinosolvens TaxID=57704 RepID=UPI002DD44A0C|nr:hypothetical protein [Tsukamurella tyrosinosolvens]MEC4614575.1 hypothetical protein [Tsukamurella tyrosinosolvens]